jgi:hypothetical protein
VHVITEVCVFGTQEENEKFYNYQNIRTRQKCGQFSLFREYEWNFLERPYLGNLTRNIQKPNLKTVRHQLFVLTSTTYRYT